MVVTNPLLTGIILQEKGLCILCEIVGLENARFLWQEMQGLSLCQCNSLRMLWILQYVDEKRWLAPRGLGLCAVNQHILKGVERKKVL